MQQITQIPQRYIDVTSNLVYQLIYIYDTNLEQPIYVGPEPLFITRLMSRDSTTLSTRFMDIFTQTMNKENYQRLKTRFTHKLIKLTQDQLQDAVMIFNIKLQLGKQQISFIHKASLIDKNSALCSIALSTYNGALIKPAIRTQKVSFLYDEQADLWNELTNIVFSPREQDIARLTMQGLSEYDIAQILCVSASAIKRDKRLLFDKLEVKNMQEAIAVGFNYKLF